MVCTACSHDPDVGILKQYTIVLERKWPSQNELKSNTKRNFKYKQIRERFIKDIAYQTTPNMVAKGYRRIYLSRYFGYGPSGKFWQQPYDYGNLVGGGKALLDAIVWCGLLYDDSPKYCEQHYPVQERSPDGKDRIVIVLQDLVPKAEDE